MAAERDAIQRQKGGKSRWLSTALLLVLLLVATGFGVYSFHEWRKAVADNPMTTQHKIIHVVDSMVIAPNETPQIATVDNAAKLTNSLLARTAKNGDVLLIYNKAGRIIVYRPTNHKIVDILDIQSSKTPESKPK